MPLTRRTFLALTTVAGAGLTVGFQLGAAETARGPWRPNAFLKITPEGRVVVTVVRSEMGQGVRTSLPMTVAEELGADWAQVDLETAEIAPEFGDMGTGGSMSTQTTWAPLRHAAAAAREMLLAAAARIWNVPAGDCAARGGEVLHPASGRRLGFGALAAAAAGLPVPKDPPLRDPASFTLVGRPVRRYDGPRIVDGSAPFGIDTMVPGMVRAVLVRCPVHGGRARGWDQDSIKGRAVLDVVAMAGGHLAVLAEDTWTALDAAGALKVDWDLGPAKDFSTEGFRALLAGLADQPGLEARNRGDLAKALGSGQRLQAVYEWPFQAHALMEVPNAIAKVSAGTCEVWTGTQSPNDLQTRAAKLLGLKPEAVRVHLTLLGGGFGRRGDNDIGLEAVELARATGRTVQVVWTREDELVHDHFHPMSLHHMEAALQGKELRGWLHRIAAPSLYLSGNDGKRDEGLLPNETLGAADPFYRIPDFRVEYAEAPCHLVLGALRSIQEVPNVFARECFLDEVAAALGRDPVALRGDLLGPDRTFKDGDLTIETGRLRRVLDLAAAKAGWGSRPAGRGLGVALYLHFTGTYVAVVAEVSVAAGVLKVHRLTAAVDCGLVVNPLGATAQLEGGLLFGLSHLAAATRFRDGRAEPGSLGAYPIQRMAMEPELQIHFVPSKEAPVGLGEPPVPPVAPAILNALFAATGRRIRRLPLVAGDLA
jgi:CO/xanthine dehydrogenase Mo-binding subunit